MVDPVLTVRIATRQSLLALKQAQQIEFALRSHYPYLRTALIKLSTQGDRAVDQPLSFLGGKGVFVKELEDALLRDEADIAVHSLKDVPAVQAQGLSLVSYCAREDARDVWISHEYPTIAGVPYGAVVGTSSLRRAVQLQNYRPDIEVLAIRGNVDTRLKKLKTQRLSGIVLAAAGMHRLGRQDEISQYLSPSAFLPAPGQGIVVLQCRTGDRKMLEVTACLNDPKTSVCALAERTFNRVIGGSCQLPIGAYAYFQGPGEVILYGFLATPDGKLQVQGRERGLASEVEEMGEALALRILKGGGQAIVDSLISRGNS
jgi:hydroxymethylbilane synthase